MEEFLLASFPLPATPQALVPPTVSAVAYPQASKQDGRLCVASAAVGLSVYDLADQTPLSSITLGPSFRPTTSAVSRSASASSSESIRVKSVRQTWVGVEAEGETGEVWNWSEQERKDGSTEGDATKVVYPTSAPISAIIAPRTLPNHLLLLAATGSLALATSDNLSIVASLGTSSGTPVSQSVHAFPLVAATSFLPSSIVSLIPSHSKGAHVVLVVRKLAVASTSSTAAGALSEISTKKFKKTKRPSSAAVIEEAEAQGADAPSSQAQESKSEIEVVLLDPEVEIEDEMEAQPKLLSLGTVQVVGEEVVVSEDGFVSALANRSLLSYRLTFSGPFITTTYSELFTSPLDSPPSLTVTPIKTFALSTTALTSSSTTLLALHSAFVLTASVRPASSPSDDSTPAVVALLWDVRLGAVISATNINVPSAVSTTRSLRLSLSLPTPHTATLSLSPSTTSASTPARTVIFALPLSILPTASVLAAVVGKHSLTRTFLRDEASVVEKAKRAEPVRHPRTSKGKLSLLEASEQARETVLLELEAALINGDAGVPAAEKAFERFVDGEKKRLTEYNLGKIQLANEKEQERRVKALQEKEQLKASTVKYQAAKRRIETVIQESGGDAVWKEVTGKRIKGVSDVYRYKYYDQRKALEEEMGKIVVDKSHERAMQAIERQEPNIPSAFVTAVLRLCFPEASDVEAEAGSSKTTRQHPTGIVSYLLERHLVGDGQIIGGVTQNLARAGDWANVQKALETLPDIPETTSVALLHLVVLEHLTPSKSTLSTTPPSLRSFLTSFVESPCTPATLRASLQQRLTAVEALPVLEVLDGWLGWWAKRGGGGGEIESGKNWKSEGRSKPKRLATNPFLALAKGEGEEEKAPPRVEDIVPLVQAILDAHFVTLLLHRQSHSLLRRLRAHVATHVALSTDLGSLLGALSIYARAKEQQRNESAPTATTSQSGAFKQQRDLGESMAARVKAQEKHLEVGEYAVDQFYL